MNREIKFRAWCDFDTIEESHKTGMIYFSHLELDNGLWFNPDDESVYHINEWLSKPMQFTGLLDKNGKEVFESDVDQFKRVVRLYRGNFVLESQNGNDWCYLSDCEDIEIIGNLHEHPELLTK